MTRKFFQLILLGLPLFILMNAVFALTASNTVPESGMDYESHSITANQLKPSACIGLDLTNTITNGNGTADNDLVLGTIGIDTLNGSDGDDCLVAGDGDDTLDGGSGTDICIGGAGDDVFPDCETIIDP